MDLKHKIIKMMNERIILLPILSISFLLLLVFTVFDISRKSSVSIEIDQHHTYESKHHRNDKELIIFSKSKYLNQPRKISENVIVFLVPSASGDIRLSYNGYPRLRERVFHLDERFSDNYTTDVIIFHTGYPFREDLLTIINGSRRHVEFVNIDRIFYRFPSGFDPHIRDPTWSVKGKWNYHHMCNFWFKKIFEMKILQRYRYMMRLDDDSQILGTWPNIFDLMIQKNALYLANQRELDYEYVLPGLKLVRNFTAAFINEKKIIVKNPNMFIDFFKDPINIPNFWNNFEIIDLAFMKRKEVVDFIEVINKAKGIFLYRWGDATLRYVTIALFMNASEILHREALLLEYCHQC